MPNAVLDVVVNTPLANMERSSPKNLSEESVWVLAEKDDVAVTATATVRRNPVSGLMGEVMENYSHIERPLASPNARGSHALLDDQSPDNDNSPAFPQPENSKNPPSQVPQNATASDTPGEQRDLTQTIVRAACGDNDAQVTLGDAYRDGEGVPQDYQAAMDGCLKAAEQEDPVGQQ